MAAPEHTSPTVVTIVGAGVAGAACAAGLAAAGIGVRLIERGRAPGGRMASPLLHGRRVDLGAGYFTVRDSGFQSVVDRWQAAGLARPWTDTFAVLELGRQARTTSGPTRWAAPGGLRSLVRQELDEVEVALGCQVNALPDGPVVLAMPDPQAAQLAAVPAPVDYLPVITLVTGFQDRSWSLPDAAFVHGHPDIDFLADDGARRGDGAPVLVVHSTDVLARAHLAEPDRAAPQLTAGLRELLGCAEPLWRHVHRWTYAKPARARATTFGLVEVDGRPVGFAGDQWCPEGSPRVESAWRSGTDLATALAAAL
jgi:predicted NAD/FAD-dependent oxidoreductase